MANRWATAIPFEISNYDNPETIRFRKYATGTHLVDHGTEVEAGLTPKEVVWQRGKAKLFHYESTREKKYPIPVLLVYAPILRPYILDLVPGNSFVEFLLREGFDVYLLDWGNAGPEDRHLSLEDWILDYMPEAGDGVLTDSTAEGVGGVPTGSTARGVDLFWDLQGGAGNPRYSSPLPEGRLKNLILLTTP